MTASPEARISIQCGSCHKKLRAPAKFAGKRVKCPCGTAIDVPSLKLKPESQPPNPNLVQCPDCNAMVSRRAQSCPKCGSPFGAAQADDFGGLDLPGPAALTMPTPQPVATQQSAGMSMQPIGEGKFICNGSYHSLFDAAHQALLMSKVKIKNASPTTGEIHGNARYGINAFGMTIYARVFASGAQTTVEFTAKFSDAFDTVGACKKKVNQISENFAQLLHSGGATSSHGGMHGSSGAPLPSSQAGESFKGKAVTGFWLCLFGFCFGPLAIIGVIMCSQAYSNINSSNNQEGRGWALAGTIIGFIALVLWALVVLGSLAG